MYVSKCLTLTNAVFKDILMIELALKNTMEF